MKILEKNIINLFGQKGQEWLSKLPFIINQLSDFWSLLNVKPVLNMNYNYVATALQQNNFPVVLKISCDQQLILDEYKALKHFAGHGSIQVIDFNSELHALLLERALPGNILKEHHPEKLTDTMKIYATVVNKLANRPLPKNQDYPHVSDWLKAIDRISDNRIDNYLVEKAHKLRSKILNSAQHEYLCHGDLHLENIINHGANWLAIDPKGIIGEKAFEAAAFDLISKGEIGKNKNITALMLKRIALLAKILNLNSKRLLAWTFLRNIISAQWFIEDRGDPKYVIKIARSIYADIV